eukprot:5220210-Prymnesium_polylepis.1
MGTSDPTRLRAMLRAVGVPCAPAQPYPHTQQRKLVVGQSLHFVKLELYRRLFLSLQSARAPRPRPRPSPSPTARRESESGNRKSDL